MDSFRRNQEQFKSAVEGAFANTPFADMAKRNLAMFEAATQGFQPGAAAPAPAPAPAAPAASKDAEMAALKAELAALKDKIEKLGE
jgi:polyhydroxyalkanoate synthesis regulator protein